MQNKTKRAYLTPQTEAVFATTEQIICGSPFPTSATLDDWDVEEID